MKKRKSNKKNNSLAQLLGTVIFKNNKNSKKGFTLAELLAVVAILALVFGIGIASYGRVSSRVKKNSSEFLKTQLYEAGVKYSADTGLTDFLVKDLVTNGYYKKSSDSIVDPYNGDNLECFALNMTKKKASDAFTKIEGCSSANIPATLSIKVYDFYTNREIGNNNVNTKVYLTPFIGSGLCSSAGISCSYSWEDYSNPGVVASSSDRLEFTPEIDSEVAKTYYLVVNASNGRVYKTSINLSGNTFVPKIQGLSFLKKSGSKYSVASLANNNWYTNNGYVSIKLSKTLNNLTYSYSTDGTTWKTGGAADSTYGYIFSKEFTDGKRTVYVKACNGSTNCDSRQITVNIDSVAPTCTVNNTGGVSGDNNWFTGGTVTATGICSDAGSGCTESSHIIQQISSGSGNVTATYAFTDNAGNSASCSSTIKYDSEAPTCNVTTSGGTAGTNGWYKGGTVVVTGNCTDTGSGCVDSSKEIQRVSSNTSASGSSKSITISDKAGNTATCTSVIKYDKTAPTCTVKTSGGTVGDNGWYKGGTVTISGTCSDSLSGCAEEVQSSTLSSNTSASGKKYSYTVKDNAGNSTACEDITVKYDKTAPTCTVNTSGGTAGTNGWYKGGTVKAVGTCSDSLSGCVTTSVDIQEVKSNTAGSTKSITIKDKAGNTATCSSTIKYDKTAPTCTAGRDISNAIKGKNGWFVGGTVGVWATCDDSGSGCVTDTKRKNISSDTAHDGNSYTFKVTDNAGNETACTTLNVKYDSTPPTVSSLGTNDKCLDYYKQAGHSHRSLTLTDDASGISASNTNHYFTQGGRFGSQLGTATKTDGQLKTTEGFCCEYLTGHVKFHVEDVAGNVSEGERSW